MNLPQKSSLGLIGAAVAAILASESQWMTAQRLEVSGGQNI